MSQVFISYSKKQKPLANKFKRKVEKAGFTVWMDTDLRAGKNWRDTIEREIRHSIAVLVLMTPEASRSQYVTYECGFAYGADVRVIPAIFLDPKRLHARLDVVQYRDFRKGPLPWKDLIDDLHDADSASSSQLKIHYAAWGVMKDVTVEVQSRISNAGISLTAKKELFGNPRELRGLSKELRVFYSKHNESHVAVALEHGNLQIAP